MSQSTTAVQTDTKLDEVLRLASLGWSVHPCEPGGKKPLTRWRDESTTDPKTIKAWAAGHPACNWGCDTGKSGLLVVDVDRHGDVDGLQTMKALEARHGRLPNTSMSRTGGNGRHAFFRAPAGGKIGNTAGKLGPGVDTRGQGGYVVVSPSKLTGGGEYCWVEGFGPWDQPLAEAPPWLIQLLSGDVPAESPQMSPAVRVEGGGLVSQGARNDTLFKLGASLRAKDLSGAAIEAALQEENRLRCQPPLPVAEVRAIAQSVGKFQPGTSEDHDRREKAQKLRDAGLDPAEFDFEVEDDPLEKLRAAFGVPIVEVIEELTPTEGRFLLALEDGRRIDCGRGEDMLSHRKASARIFESERVVIRAKTKEWPDVCALIAELARVVKLPDSEEEGTLEALTAYLDDTQAEKLTGGFGPIPEDTGGWSLLKADDGTVMLRLDEFSEWVGIRRRSFRITRKRLSAILTRFGFVRVDVQGEAGHRRFWKGQVPGPEVLTNW